MCDRDKQLIAELVVVNRELRALTDRALAGQLNRSQWSELADTLAGAVWRCRDLGTEDVPDFGDAGGR